MAATRVLVAGIGNVFLGDDGFGPEVVRRLHAEGGLPDGVRMTDYGIRGLHLAYDVLDGVGALVLVDALPTAGGPPGAVVVLEVPPPAGFDAPGFDAHAMNPVAVLAAVERLGGRLPPAYVVGCRVAAVDEGIGLTAPVAAAVPGAASAVRALVDRLSVDRTARSRRV